MKKYYRIENYAKKYEIDRSTASRSVSKRVDLEFVEIAKLPKLIAETVNDDPYIISLMNLKGGCGKTTLAVHLASQLSKLDYKVLLIDTDHQNQCMLFFDMVEHQYTLKDVIVGKVPLQEAIYKASTSKTMLDIVFSDYEIAIISPEMKDINVLKTKLESVKQDYDFIIIDTSPNFDKLAQNVAVVSTNILIPMIPNKLNIAGVSHNLTGLKQICKIDVDTVVTGLVLNNVEEKLSQHQYYIDLFVKDYPAMTFDSTIPKAADISNACEFSTNVFDYKEKSKGSQALKKFVWETLQRL